MLKVLKYSVICSSLILTGGGGNLLASSTLNNKDSKNIESTKMGMLLNTSMESNKLDSKSDRVMTLASVDSKDFIESKNCQDIDCHELLRDSRNDNIITLAENETDSNKITESSESDSKETSENKDDKDKEAKAYKLQAVTTTAQKVSTASGYEQNLRDAPASISVITSEEIMTRPIRDIGDAVQDIPGVYTEQDKTGQNTIKMRGMESKYTLILIDGKRQNTAQGFIANALGNATSFMPPASMIERIEVIRGPASIIYGSDAMGGVINVITKKHSDKLTMGIQAETKLFEEKEWGNVYGANGYIFVPLIKQTLSLNLRGGGRYNEQNGFRKPSWATLNTTNDPRGPNPYMGHSATGSHNWNAGLRLTYTPDKHNTIYLDSEVYNGRFGSLNTSRFSFTSVQEMYKTNNVLSHEAEYDWGKLSTYGQYTFTVIAAHAMNSGNEYPSDGGIKGLPPGASKGDYINWANRRENHNAVFQSTYNKQFNFNAAGFLIFSGGVYYMYERLHDFSSRSPFDKDMHQVAVFAEGEYHINDYISTTLGLRYNYSNIFDSRIPNPRVYINYTPTEWLTIKAGIASGMLTPQLSYIYYGPTESTSNNVTTYTYGNYDIQPELSWNYELSTMFDTKYFGAVLTGYYTDFTNKIAQTRYYGGLCEGQVGNATQCYIYTNLGKSLMAGLEVGANLKPFYGFSLDTSYSFTYTQRLEGEYKGEPLVEVPFHAINVTPKYTWNDFSIYLRWTGRFMTPTDPSSGAARTGVRNIVGKYYKDYQLVDIAATYKFFKHYIVTFAVNNLFDVYFMDYSRVASTNNAGVTSYSAQNNYQRILPSRNYWLTLRVEF
ncbi:TonB-dependent receptor domain-containing protein [Helicobacter saguini]|nr:TonB-dependent receptor [Helicobacter saguini]